MRYHLLLLVYLFFGIADCLAQSNRYTCIVTNADTREPLNNVAITLTGSKATVLSNSSGSFELIIDEEHRYSKVTFSHVAFKPLETLPGNLKYRVALKKNIVEFEPIFLGKFPMKDIAYSPSSNTDAAEKPASYPTGFENVRIYVGNSLFNKVNGERFAITFTIDETGKAVDIKSENNQPVALAAIDRMFKDMPLWTPAKQHDSNTAQYFRLSIIPAMPEEAKQANPQAGERKIVGRILDSKTQKPIKNATIIRYGRTEGTLSNALGFFEISVSPGESFVASHVGFATIKFSIPESDKFNILLQKEYISLGSVVLSDYPVEATTPQPLPVTANEPNVVQKSASFPGGIESLHTYVGNTLTKITKKVRRAFEINFTVDATGKAIDVTTSDSTMNKTIAPVFETMPMWSPAVQAGSNVSQNFSLWVFNSNPELYRFDEYILSNARQPSRYRYVAFAGTVYVNFNLYDDGVIYDIKAVSEVDDYSADAEKLLQNLPTDLGKLLISQTGSTRFTLPVTYMIKNSMPVPPPTPRVGYMLLKEVVIQTGSAEILAITSIDGGALETTTDESAEALNTLLDAISGTEAFTDVEQIGARPLQAKRIVLKNKGLASVPKEIFACKHLESLDLENNKVASIPTSIGSLSKLRWLFLVNNQIEQLPPDIAKLNNLSVLSLANNKLTSLPPALTFLNRLQQLDLTNNKIQSLPAGIGQMKGLQVISLANNGLTSLPEEFFTLRRLKKLVLTGNQLSSETIYRVKETFRKAEIVF